MGRERLWPKVTQHGSQAKGQALVPLDPKPLLFPQTLAHKEEVPRT